MDAIHPYRPNALAGNPLDRAGNRRGEDAWINALLSAETSLFLPVWRAQSFIDGMQAGAPRAGRLTARAVASHIATHPWVFLGMLKGDAVFAIDFSTLNAPPDFAPGTGFADLWRVGSVMPDTEASMLAHARGLMHWRNGHRFCSKCGGPCRVEKAGHVMQCDACGTAHFPRTDPAVIMLVTDGERALLAQPTNLRRMSVFTTLAGFVEPGESLEETVAREVFEETGVHVVDVRYQSSQPWPFPASIMLGFTARATSREITIDPVEIAAAAWFTRAEAAAQDGFVLPPDFSIARRLIDAWLAG